MGESKELPTRPMRMLGFAIIIVIFIIIWLFLWFVLYQIFFLYINLVLNKKKKPICRKSEIASRRRKRFIRFIVVCLFLKFAHESF